MNENKYDIKDGKIVNRVSGQPIPEDEPIMIFRAQDTHAAKVLAYYALLAKDPMHAHAIDARLKVFQDWAKANPDKMKEPDTA